MDWCIASLVSGWTACVATADFVRLPIECPFWRLYQDASIKTFPPLSSCVGCLHLSSVHLGVKLRSHVTSVVLHHMGTCQAGYRDFTPSPVAWAPTSLHLHECLLLNPLVLPTPVSMKYCFQHLCIFSVFVCVCGLTLPWNSLCSQYWPHTTSQTFYLLICLLINQLPIDGFDIHSAELCILEEVECQL